MPKVRTVIELTKDEALQAVGLQVQVLTALTNRDMFFQSLFAKYRVNPQDYNIDLDKGLIKLAPAQ